MMQFKGTRVFQEIGNNNAEEQKGAYLPWEMESRLQAIRSTFCGHLIPPVDNINCYIFSFSAKV